MTYTVQACKQDLKMKVVPLDELKPHEKGSALYMKLIKKELLKDGMLRYPIIADEKTFVILDGMHRWLALKNLGCTLIPALLVNTRRDPRIRIGTRRIHRYQYDSDPKITVDKVISAGLTGRLMEPKSTRHFFPFSKFQQINYPIRLLGRRDPQDVSKYLAKTTEKQSKAAFEQWLREISEELKFLTSTKEEVEMELAEFLSRVRSLSSTSIL
jgi:hypothetical protein